jgi:hypothetical protein
LERVSGFIDSFNIKAESTAGFQILDRDGRDVRFGFDQFPITIRIICLFLENIVDDFFGFPIFSCDAV